MQNLFRYTLLAVLLSGCYATTDKYILPKKAADTASWNLPVNSEIDAAEYRKVYQAASSFYETSLAPTRFNGGILVAKKGQVIFEKYNGTETPMGKDKIDSASSFHLA